MQRVLWGNCVPSKLMCQSSKPQYLRKWLYSEIVIVVVQSLSHVQLFVTPWIAARQASLSFSVFQSLLKFMSVELVMPSNHLIFCHLLLLLPSIFPSIRVFPSKVALCIRWPSIGASASASVVLMTHESGLISFRMDWTSLISLLSKLITVQTHNPRGHGSLASFTSLWEVCGACL